MVAVLTAVSVLTGVATILVVALACLGKLE
jgi:hypothetical protein